ncbi:MAG: AAA family ATPase [Acetobacteraceae bacterium]
MRLKRLDLIRFGKFTGHVIDFGDRPDDGPDLHFIYGPNEAGKSTALAAFLDLLFKIGNHYDFLHKYDTMRVGACLEFDGGVHEFVRIKRSRNDLLDGNGLPISEAIIAGQLGGIDRQSYRAMFSLDDDTLEAGGESILASKGDFGELLFSASAGLADLSRTLSDLRSEADGYYRFHARTGELQTLKARLAELKTQREQSDTIASRYAQLIDARDRAWIQYNESIASRTAIHARIDEIQSQLSALPRLTALRDARTQLLPMGDSPTPPDGWPELLRELQKTETELAMRSDNTELEIPRISSELETIIVDEAALAIADRVERLGPLHARHVTAEADLPDRARQVRELELEITAILGRIGRGTDPAPERLLLDAATVGALNALIAKRSGVETALLSSTQELSDAQYELEEALTVLREADVNAGSQRNDASLAALAAVVATLYANDYAAQRRTAERSLNAFQETLAGQLRALHPWHGDIDQLAAAQVPGRGDLSRWKAVLAKAVADNDLYHAEDERLTSERLRLEAEHAGIVQVTNDHDAVAIRAAREAAWAEHRRKLEAASAELFEAALRRDDLVVEARLNLQAHVAKLQESSRSLARAEAAAKRAAELRTTAAAALQRICDEIAAAVAPLLPGAVSVDQVEAWLAKRDKALETNEQLQQSRRDLREVEADSAEARLRLVNAFDAASIPHEPDASVDALRAMAQAMLDSETRLKGLRTAVERCQRNVKLRERNHTTATVRDQEWQAAWQTVCTGCWLGETASSPALTTVREILPAIEDLRRAIDQRSGLIERINAMRADQAAFADAVNAIAGELCLYGDVPLDLERMLIVRIHVATTARTARAAKARELEQAIEQRRQLAEAREIHDRRKAEMTGFFSVGSLSEVARKLEDARSKAALLRQEGDAKRDILDLLRSPSIEAAECVLADVDRAMLQPALIELKARFDDQDRRSRELFSVHSKAADQVEAVGGDDAVAKIEEQRRTILLEIEEGARRYLRLRFGIVAAEQALRSYRQHHRNSMMRHASDAFRTISRGAYVDLDTQTNKDKEDLIAIEPDGRSKIVSVLSKGTRFQLYFALRVAGYHEFARMRPPVPFIADDIMETFDNFRAEEAIRLLAGMGEVGQVIYLTHHPHLCDIAQRVCPGVRVHEIPLAPS